LEAHDLETTLNFAQVERERGKLLKELVGKLNKNQISDLLNLTVAYRMGQLRHTAFYKYLWNLCQKNDISLTEYGAMNSYIQYVLLSDTIDAEAFYDEINKIEHALADSLTEKPEEEELLTQSKHLHLVRKLLDFSLTPQEWKQYRSFASKDSRLVLSPQSLDLTSFEAFYKEASRRDQAITDNLLKAMEKEGADSAVLVVGGFHAEGITDFLKEKGVTVVSFVPKITQIESDSGSAYLSVFTQEKTPLEKLFEGEKLFIASHPMGNSVFSQAAAYTRSSIEETKEGNIPKELDTKGYLSLCGTGCQNHSFDVWDVGKETEGILSVDEFGLNIHGKYLGGLRFTETIATPPKSVSTIQKTLNAFIQSVSKGIKFLMKWIYSHAREATVYTADTVLTAKLNLGTLGTGRWRAGGLYSRIPDGLLWFPLRWFVGGFIGPLYETFFGISLRLPFRLLRAFLSPVPVAVLDRSGRSLERLQKRLNKVLDELMHEFRQLHSQSVLVGHKRTPVALNELEPSEKRDLRTQVADFAEAFGSPYRPWLKWIALSTPFSILFFLAALLSLLLHAPPEQAVAYFIVFFITALSLTIPSLHSTGKHAWHNTPAIFSQFSIFSQYGNRVLALGSGDNGHKPNEEPAENQSDSGLTPTGNRIYNWWLAKLVKDPSNAGKRYRRGDIAQAVGTSLQTVSRLLRRINARLKDEGRLSIPNNVSEAIYNWWLVKLAEDPSNAGKVYRQEDIAQAVGTGKQTVSRLLPGINRRLENEGKPKISISGRGRPQRQKVSPKGSLLAASTSVGVLLAAFLLFPFIPALATSFWIFPAIYKFLWTYLKIWLIKRGIIRGPSLETRMARLADFRPEALARGIVVIEDLTGNYDLMEADGELFQKTGERRLHISPRNIALLSEAEALAHFDHHESIHFSWLQVRATNLIGRVLNEIPSYLWFGLVSPFLVLKEIVYKLGRMSLAGKGQKGTPIGGDVINPYFIPGLKGKEGKTPLDRMVLFYAQWKAKDVTSETFVEKRLEADQNSYGVATDAIRLLRQESQTKGRREFR